MTLRTNRCSGSMATWSQWSPFWSSLGLLRSQCFSFLATKDHFSSNCTSRVCGGKSHEFVVELLGVPAGRQGQADHGILVNAGQATGLADADPFLEVGQGVHDFGIGESAVEQGGALTL